jgi:flagellum-specific peptidoglycan hydrolase FlgJ
VATPQQLAALAKVYAAAVQSCCLFPEAQACEAMVETSWMTTVLGYVDHNLFGTKQHEHPIYGTVNLPTKEFINSNWIVVNAAFVLYPDFASCFADRMATLNRLAPEYPHYAAALAATTPEEFLTQVSLTWSTGPTRGEQCIEILHAHQDILQKETP